MANIVLTTQPDASKHFVPISSRLCSWNSINCGRKKLNLHSGLNYSVSSKKKLFRHVAMAVSNKSIPINDAIIIGGGISGLVTAIVLREAGINVKVYEKEEDEKIAAGTLISLWPNGLKALSTINNKIVPLLKERGSCIRTFRVISFEGQVLSDKENTHEEKHGFPMLCIRWSRILDTLREFLPSDAIHTGYAFTGKLTQTSDKVFAILDKNGKEIEVKADILIGSDGIRSLVRKAVLGEKDASPRDNERSVWRLIMPRNELETEWFRKDSSTLAIGKGRTFSLCDSGENQVYVAFTCMDEVSNGETLERSKSPEECKEKLLKLFSDAPGLLPVIEKLNSEAIIERRVVDLPPLPYWSSGRVVLVGDSAHAVTPSLGQGANMAMEDALELTKQLLSHSSLDEALQSYERVHRPRIETIVNANQIQTKSVYSTLKVPVDSGSVIFDYPRLTEKLDLSK